MRTSALVIAAALLMAAPASADKGRLADFDFVLSASAPGSPAGVHTKLLLHREKDPDAKPSPLRSAVIHAPKGTRFDTTAVPQCTATDEELTARGSDACPPETELTVGSFSAMTGFGPPLDPLAGDDHVFNGPDQIIEVITAPGGSASPAFDRVTIEGGTLTAHPPVAPGGPPEGESSVRSSDFTIPVRTAGEKSLITTPPKCPASGRWVTTATFDFADGTSDTVRSATPCERPKRRAGERKRVCRKHKHRVAKRCARRR